MKVFISQPMRGLTEEEIFKNRADVISAFREIKKSDGMEVHYIDNYNHGLPEDASPLLYLGEDIQRMAEADIVIMAPGWTKARGCRAEYHVACTYEMTILTAHPMKDGSIKFRDLTIGSTMDFNTDEYVTELKDPFYVDSLENGVELADEEE